MTERPGVRIHPSAVIDEPCEIGEGTAIWHFVHLMRVLASRIECYEGSMD